MRSAVQARGLWTWLPWLGAGLAFVLYLRTLAPGIEFGDAGELVTAAARLWVPHPSGYPLFLLLGHLFAKLPIGSEEFARLNLMSALFCALGLGLFGTWMKLVLDLACSRAGAPEGGVNRRRRRKDRKRQRGRNPAEPTRPEPRPVSEDARWIIATFGALLLGLSRTYWSLSASAEVYPIFIVFLAANLLLFSRYLLEPDVRRQRRLGMIWAFVVGLSFTAHLSTSLLAPAFLLTFFARFPTWKQAGPRLLSFAGPFALGLSPFLLLPVLAQGEPHPNWLYPLSAGRLFEHISGARYQSWMGSAEGYGRNLPIFLQLPRQFGYVGFGLAIAGCVWAARKVTRLLVLTLIAFLTCFLYAVTYRSVEIEPFFLLCHVVTALWGALGVLAVFERLPRLPLAPLLGTVVAVSLAAAIGLNYREVDRSRNDVPRDLLSNMLGDALPNAVIFSDDFFRFQSPLMYLQYVRGVRPDVDHVSVALLTEPFYLRSLEKNQPGLYTSEMRALRDSLGERKMTKEEYQKEQISFIVRRVDRRPIYFENTVKHALIPSGYRIVPEGLLYRVTRQEEAARPPAPPKRYPFRDASYVDYNVDKARNNYLTMLYANGLQAERTGERELARQFYRYALTFFPASPDQVSVDEEGRALRSRKQEVEGALARLR